MHAFWLIELSNKLTLIKNKNSNLCAYMAYEILIDEVLANW